MNRSKVSETAPFQRINAACEITGISRYALRAGCKDGSVPHIIRNGVYFINVPALLRQLEEESKTGGRIGA